MLHRYIVPSLIALTMVLGASSASSNEPMSGSDDASLNAPSAAIVEETGGSQRAEKIVSPAEFTGIDSPADGAQKSGSGSCAPSTETMSTEKKEGENSNPCDTACECCGLWNVPACCDKCWTCWYNS